MKIRVFGDEYIALPQHKQTVSQSLLITQKSSIININTFTIGQGFRGNFVAIYWDIFELGNNCENKGMDKDTIVTL
jgi:hypothetical protein